MSNLLTDISDGIGTLTLNAPEARNTMTMPMVEEICAQWMSSKQMRGAQR